MLRYIPGILLVQCVTVVLLWAERFNAKLRVKHAEEKEKLAVNVERDKAKILLKNQKEMRRHEKSVGRKASLKVGLAFMGATLMGVLMIIVEMFTFGLMTITTALGGMGGYLVRSRQVHDVNNANPDVGYNSTDVDATFSELPPPPKALTDESN